MDSIVSFDEGNLTPKIEKLLSFLGSENPLSVPSIELVRPKRVALAKPCRRRHEVNPLGLIVLGSVSINLARAVGSALGGIIVASAGVEAVFLLNAVTFGGMILAIYRWQETPRKNSLPPEHIIGAMITGVRYVKYAPYYIFNRLKKTIRMSASKSLIIDYAKDDALQRVFPSPALVSSSNMDWKDIHLGFYRHPPYSVPENCSQQHLILIHPQIPQDPA